MKNFVKTKCIIRSYASGVHFGTIKKIIEGPSGTHVILENSRRIHYWEGACSLSQVAMDGIRRGRVAMELPEIMVLTVSEIIPMSEKAITNLENMEVWQC